MRGANNIFQVVAPVPYYADITVGAGLQNLAIATQVKRGAVGHMLAEPVSEPVCWRIRRGRGVVNLVVHYSPLTS